MTDTNKIVAAILTAGMCSRLKDADQAWYLRTYDEIVNSLESREKAKKKPLNITPEVLDAVAKAPRRKRL